MKKIYTLLSCFCILLAGTAAGQDQQAWPRTITRANGTVIKMYQWEPESIDGNQLQGRAAISVVPPGESDPVFGVAWFTATTNQNAGYTVVESVSVSSLRLPGEDDQAELDAIQNALETAAGTWGLSFKTSDLNQQLSLNQEQDELAQEINNKPPRILYSKESSLLVQIDGTPRIQKNDQWGLDAVVNTPYTIVKGTDNNFYLYVNKHWYKAPAATGPFAYTTHIPQALEKVEKDMDDMAKADETEDDSYTTYSIANIIVSTEPAELIQSRGEATFSPIDGTDLLYVNNSDNDIFMDIPSQEYFVLLSGRWYHSRSLEGEWSYMGADQLPADFANIPPGSPKDNVLASVGGTPQAQDAVEEAQVPQTAKVDRNSAEADISYDGDPIFEPIDGTEMYYAVNSPASVIRWRGRYYSVSNGIWFEARYATGPWVVCVNRPSVVALIPPRYPVYHMKYVYIYDVTPTYVYMGYTPGYLNTYIYGSTIVYGTGYYYNPWYYSYYIPRPCTWGFGMRYAPWVGWGFGVHVDIGWFHIYAGRYSYPYYRGGWWGPAIYRPPYCYNYGYYPRGGYYGGRYGGGIYGRYGMSRNVTIVNNYYNRTNIYGARPGRNPGVRPMPARPGGINGRTASNNGFNSGRLGNGRQMERVDRPSSFNGGRTANQPGRVDPGPGRGTTPMTGGRTQPGRVTNTPDRNPGRVTQSPGNNRQQPQRVERPSSTRPSSSPGRMAPSSPQQTPQRVERPTTSPNRQMPARTMPSTPARTPQRVERPSGSPQRVTPTPRSSNSGGRVQPTQSSSGRSTSPVRRNGN